LADADRDLARLGDLGHRDPQRQHTVVHIGLDVFGVEALSEMDLAPEGTAGPFGEIRLIAVLPVPVAFGRDGQHAALDVDVDGVGGNPWQVDVDPHVLPATIGVERHRQRRCSAASGESGEQEVHVSERVVLQQHGENLLVR
jgi:hypothetical protein